MTRHATNQANLQYRLFDQNSLTLSNRNKTSQIFAINGLKGSFVRPSLHYYVLQAKGWDDTEEVMEIPNGYFFKSFMNFTS